MKRVLLTSAILIVAAGAFAQGAPEKKVQSVKTQAVIERLQGVAFQSAVSDAVPLPEAKAAGDRVFDSSAQVLPKSAVKPAPQPQADDGIVFPEDPPKKDEGEDPGSPADQLAKMLAEAMKKKEFKDAVDGERQRQIDQVFTKEVKIGAAVAGAGLVTAGIGLIAGTSAVTGVGLAVFGAVILAGALFAIFGKKKKQ